MAGRLAKYGYRTAPARARNAATSQLSRGGMPPEFRELFKRTLSDIRNDAALDRVFERSLTELRRSASSRSLVPLIGKAVRAGSGVPLWLARLAMGQYLGDYLGKFASAKKFPENLWNTGLSGIEMFSYFEIGCDGYANPAEQGAGWPAGTCFVNSASGPVKTLAFAAAQLAAHLPTVEADIASGLTGVWLVRASLAVNPENSARVVAAGPDQFLRVLVAQGAGFVLPATMHTVQADEEPGKVPAYSIRHVVTKARVELGWGQAAYEWPATKTQTQRLPPHENRPPRRGEKEQKRIIVAPLWWSSFINALTETDDFLDAALDAMVFERVNTADQLDPFKRMRDQFDGLYTTREKAQFVYENWQHVDFGEFLKNLVLNQVEDFLIGRMSKKESENMRLLFEQFGINFSRQPSTTITRALKGL